MTRDPSMHLDPGEIVGHHLRTIAIDDVLAELARIAGYDRYQASLGIEEAAAVVATSARAAGLEGVTVARFPADGRAHWWSFEAPVSWTPTVARLTVRTGGVPLLEVDHARDPFSIATFSAGTPPSGIVAPLVNVAGSTVELAGAVAVVGRTAFARPGLPAELAAAGAIGFVTDVSCSGVEPGTEHPGRLEMDPRTPLFGFSLTSRQFAQVQARAEEGAEAHVVVQVDRSAGMPVVTGVLPGRRADGEVWLTAHLCHPRPGANDNASGVAALLGVAARHTASRCANARWGTDRTIRFLWGPEFVGTAAMLHQRLERLGASGLPSAVINLDMVGEDQALCGGPFLVERTPDCSPALLAPLAEYLVDETFARTRGHPGRWQPAPFTGFSDHALFADPRIGSPAVQFCHAPDRFNHSSGDSLDKVSPVELLRATAAAAALAQVMASDDALSRSAMRQIVRAWCAREMDAALRIAAGYRDIEGGAWGRRLVRHVTRRNEAVQLLAAGATDARGADEPPGEAAGGAAVFARWEGPFNARGMLADLPPDSRSALAALLRADKLNYALLLNFAIRVDGRRSRDHVVSETSYALQRPVDGEIAERLFAALLESGWVTEEPRPALQ